MNRLPIAKRVQILSLLCEGASMRSVSRLVDVSINTVTRELVLAGQACAAFHDRTVRNVKSKRVQCDEIWSFVGMKEKQAKRKADRPADVGDVWTWTGLDADNKLIVSWFVGGRDGGAAYEFMSELESRLANRVQMTTDGHKAYLDPAVVPKTLPNNAAEPVAEAVEGREGAEGKTLERNTLRTQSRVGVPSTLERIRQATRQQKQLRFTALLHHVYDVERLRQAYYALKREAAAGIDGETWQHYGEQLGANLQNLSQRLQRGAYRAKPVRRAYIEKADGRQRPLGVPVLEDKLVQRAVVEVLKTPSTNRTLQGSRMDSARGAGRMMH